MYKYRTEILYLVENHATTIIVGETGSGKTTQIPQVSSFFSLRDCFFFWRKAPPSFASFHAFSKPMLARGGIQLTQSCNCLSSGLSCVFASKFISVNAFGYTVLQFLKEAGWAEGGRVIACTQPRRLAVQVCFLSLHKALQLKFEDWCRS